MLQPLTKVSIELGDRSYHIAIQGGLISDPSTYSAAPPASAALIVTNTTIGPLYSTQLRAALEGRYGQIHEVQLPDGEEH